MARSRSYLGRMMAAAVSRHTVAPMPEATRAEFEAKVYDQTWLSKTSHQSRTTFSVLALDRAHAEVMGGLRLETMFGAGAVAEMLLLENVEWPFDADRVANILSYESASETACRRDAWRSRAA
jgi:hypothetical protein